MKTTSILTLVSLAVLATQASAATAQSESSVVVLPTYVVQAPPRQPAVQKVAASLNELRQQARSTAFTLVEMPLCRLAPMRLHLATLDAKAHRVAKL